MLGETVFTVTNVYQWLNILRKTCECDFICRTDICRTLSKIIFKDVTMSNENKPHLEETPSTSGSSSNRWDVECNSCSVASDSTTQQELCTLPTELNTSNYIPNFVLTHPIMAIQSVAPNLYNFNFCQTPSFYYTGVYYPPNFSTCYSQTELPYAIENQKYKGKNMSSLRKWEWERRNTGNVKPGFIFTLMCYNVLAQDLLNQHPYLYRYHDRRCLDWGVRWNNLLNEITKFKPDILCLQEIQESHLESYFSVLENQGYSRLYKKRTGERTDGCALYYKSDLVTLVEYTSVEYFQPNVPILNRDNVALIAKFSFTLQPDKEFVIATTHLLYNPRRQDVRLAQTQVLLTEIERISYDPNVEGNYLPVILTGDLNSTPDSAVYEFITTGKLKYEDLSLKSQKRNSGAVTGKLLLPPALKITDNCQHANLLDARSQPDHLTRLEEFSMIELFHSERMTEKRSSNKNFLSGLFSTGTLSHNFHFKSVYNHDNEGTTFQDRWLTVDYIFYSTNSDKGKLKLLSKYRLPTAKELQGVFIPNAEVGSDHLSLVAKFKLEY